MKTDFILILDFGSQYTQLIARRIREMLVYSEIQPYNCTIEKVLASKKNYNLKGVIFSGGPASVFEKNSPKISTEYLNYFIRNKIPVLGICYGMHLIVHLLGGVISKSKIKEYGHTILNLKRSSKLFINILKHTCTLKVWMSHGDSIKKLPSILKVTSLSQNNIISSFESEQKNIFGLQFHPEVHHTDYGKEILKEFVFNVCETKNLFKPSSFIKEKVDSIRNEVKDNYAILGLSGGVDSTVAAVLVHKAIKDKLICIHIDSGLMRKNESRDIMNFFKKNFKMTVDFVNAENLFINKLKGVIDPEQKRKIIGRTFIDVFENEALRIKKHKGNVKFLVQGTLYPDVIESVSFRGPSVTIKSHHNVGGLPDKMNLKLIEPLRELFKDEVRKIGKLLGIPSDILRRHPFPGPGLAIRIIGDVTRDKLELLREVDYIYINSLKEFNLYDKIWQAFAVLLPVRSVGVMGDHRSYENVVCLRAVTSLDGMTADFYHFKREYLTYISNKIINSIKGVNRVVVDITSKPPATIEWE
ncbi:MAG: glutamine-hydrolyzing GMP synthase [Ignavibacteria bacterium]|nr:glutamine-hydrolyzing GMP synthase [Ignavibacteria bacterium]